MKKQKDKNPSVPTPTSPNEQETQKQSTEQHEQVPRKHPHGETEYDEQTPRKHPHHFDTPSDIDDTKSVKGNKQ